MPLIKSKLSKKKEYAEGGQVPAPSGQTYAERFQKVFLGKAEGGLIEPVNIDHPEDVHPASPQVLSLILQALKGKKKKKSDDA